MADERERRDMDPGEMTRRMPEGEGAGPGAPETLEPTQGERATPGPGGPAVEGLAHDAPEDDPPGSPRTDPERRGDPDAATAPAALRRTAATAVRRLLGRGGDPPGR